LPDIRIFLQELAMPSQVGPSKVIAADTLKPPTAHGALIVNPASIIVTEKRAAALDIWQYMLDEQMFAIADLYASRKRSECRSLLR
jgi:hypothetical protein